MRRFLANRTATLEASWVDQEGDPVSPTPATTVTVTRLSDGTVLADSEDAAAGSDGLVTYEVAADDLPAPDLLDVAWQSDEGEITDRLEVVGGHLFSVAAARKVPDLADADRYPVRDIVAAREAAEEELERHCGGFFPRFALEALRGSGSSVLQLEHPWPTAIRTLAIEDDQLTQDEIGGIAIRRASLSRPGGWPRGARITVGYEHGRPSPPGRVSRAAIRQVRAWLVDRLVDDRTTRVQIEGGTVTFATAAGEPFDLPEMNAIVRTYEFADLELV